MRSDGEGRFCDRCSLRVTDVASLDGDDGLAHLLAEADGKRVCARFELERGQPRTKLGLAAGFVVVALTGCATPSRTTEAAHAVVIAPELEDDGSGGVIFGVVKNTAGAPLANAVVILQSVALASEYEVFTSERGLYVFKDLPPGNYTIQVLYAKANVSTITTLQEGTKFRANFSVDPDTDMLLGMLVEQSLLDTTSASSTYSSRLIEIP